MLILQQDPLLIYKSTQELWQTVGGVQATGKQIFADAYVVQNSDAFLKVMSELIQNRGRLDDATLKMETRFFNHSIIDSVRIVIYFESLFKACLLSKGFVIHLVKQGDRHSALFKKQRKQPILISELPPGNVEDVLTTKTLNFNWFLENQKYKDELPQIPSIFATLNKLNQVRNQLHLHYAMGYDFSPEFAQEIDHLITFVSRGPYFLENQP